MLLPFPTGVIFWGDNVEELQRDFKGVWIPKAVWLDTRLNALDKIILIEIDSLDQGERGCYASNKYLSEFCQCSESKVSKAVSKLIDYGYLRVQSFDGRQRELKSSLAKIEKQPSKKCYAEEHNLLQSNIDNNTVTNTRRKKESYSEIVSEFTENEELRNAVYEYIKMRKLIKAPMTDRALTLLLSKLQKLSIDEREQIGMLEKATLSNWKSVYAPDKSKPKQQPLKNENDIDISQFFITTESNL